MRIFKRHIITILGVALFVHAINAAVRNDQTFFEYFLDPKAALTNLLYNTFVLLLILPFFSFLDKKFSWEKQGIYKFFVGLIGAIILVLIGIVTSQYIHYVFVLKTKTNAEYLEFLSYQKVNLIFTGLIGAVITLFFMAFDFIKAVQEKKVKEQKIIANTATAKFDALRNQLDPHFLFNSLNVLTALIHEDPDAAQKFTTDLARVYRYILEQKTKDIVSLNEEIKFGKTYISLLQKRFEDCLTVNFPQELKNPEGKIIPLSLQLLLENAVKHNIVTTERPLNISVFEKDGFLYIENNLQTKTVMQSSTGVGLANIKTRYEMLKNKAFEVFKTKNTFVAKLPILNKDTTVINIPKTMTINETIQYENAQLEVRKLKEFYYNLLMYVISMIVLFTINYLYSPNYIWAIYPAIGWGIGVLAKGFTVFGRNPFITKNWETNKLNKLLNECKIFGRETDPDKQKHLAHQYIIKIKEFYHNLTTFLMVMPGLVIINYIQDKWHTPWFIYPLFGWGIGVLFHGIYTFKTSLLFNSDWEEKQIDKILSHKKDLK